MKRLLLLLVFVLLLIGCAEADTTTEPTTLFGALSARFQLGSTEETISYKQIVEPYMITTKGEVLQNRDAAMSFDIKGFDTTVNPDDLKVTFNVCTNNDMGDENRWDEPDNCQQDNLIMYTVSTVYDEQDGLFHTVENDVFYHEYGDWLGEVIIENPATNETTKSGFEMEIYEARPPTTTTFELINLLLPFVVIGLFVGIVLLRKKSFVTPIHEVAM